MNNIESKMEVLNYYAEVWGMSTEDTLAEIIDKRFILFVFFKFAVIAAGAQAQAQDRRQKQRNPLFHVFYLHNKKCVSKETQSV